MASTAKLLDDEARPLSVLDLPLKEGQPSRNRRSLPRVRTSFAVRTLGATYRGVDLSFGGLMCVGDEPLWPGNEVQVTLELDGEATPLRASARVVEIITYRGETGMRLRFDRLETAAGRRIAGWMARL